VVRAGDTLSQIAEHFAVDISVIIDTNGLADPDFIVEGQVLTIPVAVSAPARPVSPDVEPLLEQFAAEEGLDPGLVKALAYQESGWQQNVVSSTGAVGIMQIQPSTGYWLETDVFGYDLDIEMSAHDNIKAGVRYLRILLNLTGNMDEAAAAYYQGYGALSLGILYEDTVQYVASVNAIKNLYWP
jgi:soluble lytic murein transglycosylase-like protein